LILKLELRDIEKNEAISALLGVPDVVLSRWNVRAIRTGPVTTRGSRPASPYPTM
jgi:hypothetical protein